MENFTLFRSSEVKNCHPTGNFPIISEKYVYNGKLRENFQTIFNLHHFQVAKKNYKRLERILDRALKKHI